MRSHHTVKLEVSIEPDWAVSAVEGEGDIRHIRPPTLLKNNLHQCFPPSVGIYRGPVCDLPFICCLTNPLCGRK